MNHCMRACVLKTYTNLCARTGKITITKIAKIVCTQMHYYQSKAVQLIMGIGLATLVCKRLQNFDKPDIFLDRSTLCFSRSRYEQSILRYFINTIFPTKSTSADTCVSIWFECRKTSVRMHTKSMALKMPSICTIITYKFVQLSPISGCIYLLLCFVLCFFSLSLFLPFFILIPLLELHFRWIIHALERGVNVYI